MPLTVFDLETTGLPLWKEPSEHPGQPRICSIAWIDCDDVAEPIKGGRHYHLIKPDGWTVPAEVVAIHGLTTERLMDEGLPLEGVLEDFFASVGKSAYRVAYNHSFDNRMVRIEQCRLSHDETLLGWWSTGASRCAMAPMTRRVNLPPTKLMLRAGFRKPKSPTLGESHRFLFGKPHEGAHGAADDAEAARAIWQILLAEMAPAA